MPAIKVKVVKSCEQVQAFTKKFGVRNRQEAQQTPGGGGGGGLLYFFCIRRLGPSIYRSPPKKYQKFQAPQKNIWNFYNPKKYPDSVYLP